MFKPLSLFIGLRYTRAKRRNNFISFVALISVSGIALSVMVLITVLSVMNGFDEQIKERILVMARQISVTGQGNTLQHWPSLAKTISKQAHIIGVAPYIEGQGMLSEGGMTQAVMVLGADPKEERKVSDLESKFIQGSFNSLNAGDFGIAIGDQLANGLGLTLGDKVNLFIPEASVTPAGILPRFKRFTIVGIFKVGNGFGFDDRLAILNLQDAQRLFHLGNAISGLRLKTDDLYHAHDAAHELSTLFPELYVTDWTEQYPIFPAIALEKRMMAIILSLLVAIAAFNLVSTLVMVVTEKRADIAILRTIGATPKTILTIFIIQGFSIGLFGTLIGLIAGLLLASNITKLVAMIEHCFHIQFLSSNIYYVNFLPSVISAHDVLYICIISLLMSFAAALYPALQAMSTQPAEALRYE